MTIQKTSYSEFDTHVDDIVNVASIQNPVIVSSMIQRYLNIIMLNKRWKINMNQTNSSNIEFTFKKETCPQMTMKKHSKHYLLRSKIPRPYSR